MFHRVKSRGQHKQRALSSTALVRARRSNTLRRAAGGALGKSGKRGENTACTFATRWLDPAVLWQSAPCVRLFLTLNFPYDTWHVSGKGRRPSRFDLRLMVQHKVERMLKPTCFYCRHRHMHYANSYSTFLKHCYIALRVGVSLNQHSSTSWKAFFALLETFVNGQDCAAGQSPCLSQARPRSDLLMAMTVNRGS
eukprot:IDg3981t1